MSLDDFLVLPPCLNNELKASSLGKRIVIKLKTPIQTILQFLIILHRYTKPHLTFTSKNNLNQYLSNVLLLFSTFFLTFPR